MARAHYPEENATFEDFKAKADAEAAEKAAFTELGKSKGFKLLKNAPKRAEDDGLEDCSKHLLAPADVIIEF